MEYQNLDLEASNYQKNEAGDQFHVRIIESPGGQQHGTEVVTILPELRSRLRQLEKRQLAMREMIEVGKMLGNLLFPPGARRLLEQSRAHLSDAKRLRIRLRLATYTLGDLPWEYVYVASPDTPVGQDGPEGFLALDRRVSLVRYEVLNQPLVPLRPVGVGPLKVVTLLANPTDPLYRPLDLQAEQRAIEQALAPLAEVTPEFYPDATVEMLMDAVMSGAHVFHFAGHGEFKGDVGTANSSQSGKGFLVLLDGDKRAKLFPAEQLGMLMQGRGLRLAVLGACHAGRRDQVNAWTGVVPALTRAGIPAVVGMQYTIEDSNVILFSKRFYKALAAGESIDAAVTDGRQAMFFNSTDESQLRDWGVPVLYLRTEQDILFPKKEGETTTATSNRPAQAASDTRQGVFISGGTVHGPIIGNNTGTITTNYGPSSIGASSTRPPANAKATVDRVALRNVLIQRFDESELEDLCFTVESALVAAGVHEQVNLDIVGGSNKASKALNLIQFLERRGLLDYLVSAVRAERPGSI